MMTMSMQMVYLYMHVLLCIGTVPLNEVGDGGDGGGGDEVAVGDEHVGAHAGVQRQLGHHIHAGEAQLHEHHGHGGHALLAHAALLAGADHLWPETLLRFLSISLSRYDS